MVGREDVGHELLAPDQPDETGHGAYSIERKDGDLGEKHRPVIEADMVVHNIGQLVTCEPALGEGTLGLLENAAVAAKDRKRDRYAETLPYRPNLFHETDFNSGWGEGELKPFAGC